MTKGRALSRASSSHGSSSRPEVLADLVVQQLYPAFGMVAGGRSSIERSSSTGSSSEASSSTGWGSQGSSSTVAARTEYSMGEPSASTQTDQLQLTSNVSDRGIYQQRNRHNIHGSRSERERGQRGGGSYRAWAGATTRWSRPAGVFKVGAMSGD